MLVAIKHVYYKESGTIHTRSDCILRSIRLMITIIIHLI